MRIFIASGIFHPEPGGPATYLNQLLPDLLARGHEADVLTFGEPREDDAQNYPYPVTRISRKQSYARRNWAYFRAASRLWDGHDVAYVHTLGLPLPPPVGPRVVKIVGDKAWERAMNYGWIAADADIDRFQNVRQGLAAEAGKTMRRFQAQQFDHVIVPSKYLKQMVVGWGVKPEQITVVYNALHAGDPPRATQAEAREQLGLPADVPLLFTAARLTRWKGIDQTLRALARIPDVHLVVAGSGPEAEQLTAMAPMLGLSGRVEFLGTVPRRLMPLYFRAADYTLLYSTYEGLPHVLLESLHAGTPVIASDKGGNPEVVVHGENGLLVPHGDAEALAATIEQAFTPGMRTQLAAGTPAGLERFDWDILVERTMDVLKATAAR